jgi:diguanylate cyclase (GGDEF)-like protein
MRILLAEDDQLSRRILEAQLRRWQFDVLTANDGEAADRLLAEPDAPRLAIVDWMMPGLDGAEVCRRVRARGSEPYTYLLLLTSRSEKQDIVGGLDAGADDYIIKPFDPSELRVRLRAGERILELQQQLIEAREQVQDQAMRDSLTGVWSRGAVLDTLARELARAQRERGHVGLVMVDVDRFKSINDTFGHAAGDTVLREVTSRFERSLRPYDSIGRMGGEEFLIIVPGCNAINAISQAERLRNVIAREPVAVPEGAVSVTVSMGVAVAEHGKLVSPESLIRSADLALYRAKRGGRNRVEAGLALATETQHSAIHQSAG